MLRNCKVARVLPRVADCAKNDRNSILRSRYNCAFCILLCFSLVTNISPILLRCCEYALLILEYWADAPEIQRSADLYEDLIRCCVADAISEVYFLGFWFSFLFFFEHLISSTKRY